MKKIAVILSLLTLILLAACQDDGALTVPSEQAEPATAEPDRELDIDAAVEPTETTEATSEMPADEPAETSPAPAEQETLNIDLTAQLDAFLESQVYSEGGNPEGAAPGLVLLVDTPDGRYLKAAGVGSLEDGTPLQMDDRLEIGSNTKSFTIAVLMQLQEEGVLSFDDQLSDWLPELAAQIPNGEEITLRQLAAHTSGIWDYGDPIIGEAAENPDLLEVGYTPQELVQYAIDNGTPDFAPGEGWKYSNTGYILLGMIAEQASGQPLGELYQERIFDPLGLETAVFIEGVPQEGEITTQGYWWLDDGTRLNTTDWNASQGWAAGAIAMNAADLATYGQALAAGELFQDPNSLAQMLAFDGRSLLVGGAPFGLGLIDFSDGYWGHEGQTAGFQSLWYTNPDEAITVVGLSNSAAYSAYSLLNVINILTGAGVQPLLPLSLLPVGEQFTSAASSKWQWMQALDGAEVVEVPPGFVLSLARDGTASLSGPSCGPIAGTFAADAQGQIGLEFDLSAVTCPAGDPTLQLVDALQGGGSWRFDNGRLVIALAGDEGELVFRPQPADSEAGAAPGDDEVAACPLFDLPYPRPEPDYNGKLARDFTPFAEALAAYTPEEAVAREALVSGKTIPELQALMASGELTSTELVVYYLDRIQRYDVDKLNSVLELNPEALAIAQTLDEERATGSVRGAMHGIPVLLKDNIATGDELHTAAGAAAMLSWDPDRDAFLVSQLREAGAVILGKANLSEWANYMDSCMPNGFSANGGQTQNPYGPFETYGSSSGSAVSVAADLTTVSVGTETQGSIIEPAIINSVVALKPTKGLISTDYVVPLLPFQDVPGPMGRSVTDVAVLLSAMTGVDDNDFTTAASADLAGTDFTQFLNQESLEGIRVGVPFWNEEAFKAYFEEFEITDEEQQQSLRDSVDVLNGAVQPVIDALTSAGVTVVEVPDSAVPPNPGNAGPLLEYGFQQAINQFLADLGDEAPVASLEEIIAFNNEDLTNRAPYGQDHLEGSNNTSITLEEFASQQQLDNGAARNGIDIFFENYDIDVVVSKLGQMYAPAGYPALTVPSGYAEDGTPQGTVFVGGFLSEPQLLAVGYAYEQATQARVAPDLEATMALIAKLPDAAAASEATGNMAVDESVEDVPDQAALTTILGNLSYDGLFPEEAITLTDGYAAYEDPGAGTPYVQLMEPLIASGDLDGDGIADAAAVLVDHSSGSGTFYYLAAVLDALNDPAPLEALMIGDRIQVKSLAIEGGQIVADLVVQGPDEPLCCASWNVRETFVVEDGALVQRSSEQVSQVALDDLNDTMWRLLDLNGDQEPALADAAVTLHIKDGLLNGSAGCNDYRSTVEAGPEGLNSLVIGPMATTQKLCDEALMEQEAAYLARLENAASWRFDAGRLALTYPAGDDGSYGYLLFEPLND
jgi:amidase